MGVLGALALRFPRDPGAFFSEFYERVHRFVASTSGADRGDVEDLVQDTLLEAWRGRDRFRGDSEPLTWVLGIARNRVLLRRRSMGQSVRLRDQVIAAARSIDREDVPDAILQSEEMRSLVRRALDAMEEAYRQVLLLRFFEGLPIREIAGRLGEGEKAIESRLLRAREAFRHLMSRGADDDRL
jgi:RNA polymerase sigma-70 factor (ECF subfamily)